MAALTLRFCSSRSLLVAFAWPARITPLVGSCCEFGGGFFNRRRDKGSNDNHTRHHTTVRKFHSGVRSVQPFRTTIGPANRTLGLCAVAGAVQPMPPYRPKVP